MKVVYILTSTPEDFYLEMFLLSLCSLRQHDPGREINLVLDLDSYERLQEERIPLLEDVKMIPVSIPPAFDSIKKSRYLKTILRHIIEGDFLYLDIDTLICGPLAEIEQIHAEIAAVSNGNGPLMVHSKESQQRSLLAGFGDQKNVPGFNGGVLFVRDSEFAYRFFDIWRERWLQSVDRGVPFDQPALWQANLDTGCKIHELAGEWNCQIITKVGPHYFNSAKVIHYYGSLDSPFIKFILPHIKHMGEMDDVAISIAQDPKKDGFGIYFLKHAGILKLFSAHLYFRFVGCPPAYKFILDLYTCLTKPVFWILNRIPKR